MKHVENWMLNIYLGLLYMPFIHTYNGAMKILASIGNGTCESRCKSTWIRNLKYALKTKKNPLMLNRQQRKIMTEKIKGVSGRDSLNQHNKTLKKYKELGSPSCSANDNCNKQMIGNDGKMYVSKPNKNNVCSWRRL
jgi:hypothetical protein